MSKHVMKLYPWNEIVEAVGALVDKGIQIHQQFNCEKCGAKQTMDQPDTLFTSGICEECGHETNIVRNGCNYMVHAQTPQAVDALLKRMGSGK
jgi:hypothetical protein